MTRRGSTGAGSTTTSSPRPCCCSPTWSPRRRDPNAQLTVFLPNDLAFRRLVFDLTGTWPRSEADVFAAVAGLGTDTVKTVLTYHIVAGPPIGFRDALRSRRGRADDAAGRGAHRSTSDASSCPTSSSSTTTPTHPTRSSSSRRLVAGWPTATPTASRRCCARSTSERRRSPAQADFLRGGAPAPTALLGLGHALLEGGHQVDDLAARRLGRLLLDDLLALVAGVDPRPQLLGVGVVVARRLPVRRHRVEQLRRHLQRLGVGLGPPRRHVVDLDSRARPRRRSASSTSPARPSSGRIAVRYCLLRMTTVPMPTRWRSSIAASSSWYGDLAWSPSGTSQYVRS